MEVKVYGNNVLRKKSVKAEITPELIELAKEMISVMYEAKGVGLAAPQVGRNIRLVVIDLQNEEGPRILFDPEIYWVSDEEITYEEGCLSFPELSADVCRPEQVKYSYLNEHGVRVDRTAEGLEARAIQHEVDHLNGVLFIDHISHTKLMLLKKKLESLKKVGKTQE